MKWRWRRFMLKALKPWRWLRFRWRLYREPCAIAKLKMEIGWAMAGPVEETCLALAEWAEENRELIDAVNEAELEEMDNEENHN